MTLERCIKRNIQDARKPKCPSELKGKGGKVVKIGKKNYLVKLEGDKWTVLSEDRLKIENTIEIINVDGIKFIIRKT